MVWIAIGCNRLSDEIESTVAVRSDSQWAYSAKQDSLVTYSRDIFMCLCDTFQYAFSLQTSHQMQPLLHYEPLGDSSGKKQS